MKIKLTKEQVKRLLNGEEVQIGVEVQQKDLVFDLRFVVGGKDES